MSPTVSRLVLSLCIIGFLPIMYFTTFFVLIESSGNWSDDELYLLLSDVLCMLFLIVSWTVIWFGEIQWNTFRIVASIAVAGGGSIAGLIIGALCGAITNEEEIGILIGGAFAAVFWIFGTAIAWRETKSERAARLQHLGINAVACPNCGYNLTGLSQSNCPECGSSYTLDQLFAALTAHGHDV